MNIAKLLNYLILPVVCVYSHITMNPNYGAPSGGYFLSTLKIPHGTTNLLTSKVEVSIPNGVLAVKPEKVAGWDISIKYRTIPTYYSHGNPVSIAPSFITYTSSDPKYNLHNDHLLLLNLQFKFGCDYDTKYNSVSVWQNEYTLWFPTRQYLSKNGSLSVDSQLDWVSIPKNGESWGTYRRPSPYLFLYSGSRCTINGGSMVWDNVSIPVATNKSSVKNIEHVKSMINEELLTFSETLKRVNMYNTYLNSNVTSSTQSSSFNGFNVLSVFALVQFYVYVFVTNYKYLKHKFLYRNTNIVDESNEQKYTM